LPYLRRTCWVGDITGFLEEYDVPGDKHDPQILPLYTADRLKARASPMNRKIKPMAGSTRLIQGRTWEIGRGGRKK
jgi:hypothetical protein